MSADPALGLSYGCFAGKRVFVTGHTGFKGTWLTLWLTELGAKVTGYALAPEGPRAHFNELGLMERIVHHVGDVRDESRLAAAMKEAKPEIVIHMAAQALVRRSYADPVNTFTTNVTGGVNLLDAVRKTESVRSLVYITSDKCYENKEWVWGYRESDELGGKDPYSASKACAELVFRAFYSSYLGARSSLGSATTRAGNVIGGGDWSEDRLVPDCIRSLENKLPIVIRSPHSTRPWEFVLEPLTGYMDLALALLDKPAEFAGAWNFGPADSGFLTVEQVTRAIISNWGSGELKIEIDPNAVHEAGLLHLSIDKAVAKLGWHPTYTGEEAIAVTTQWYRKHHEGASAREISVRQIKEFVAARLGS